MNRLKTPMLMIKTISLIKFRTMGKTKVSEAKLVRPSVKDQMCKNHQEEISSSRRPAWWAHLGCDGPICASPADADIVEVWKFVRLNPLKDLERGETCQNTVNRKKGNSKTTKRFKHNRKEKKRKIRNKKQLRYGAQSDAARIVCRYWATRAPPRH